MIFDSQSGRSLTEMLGVLAVVGVLSIAGIMGYRYAIDKYRANSTIQELTQRALVVSTQMKHNTALQMDELGSVTRVGYPVAAAHVAEQPSYFELSLTDVPAAVCKQILRSNWNYPIMIKVNNINYYNDVSICQADDEITPVMTFQFDESLDETARPTGYCDVNSECSGCDKCEDNRCVTSCTGADRCAADYDTGIELCCPAGRRLGGYCCTSVKNGMCCNAKGQCCPWYKPLMDQYGVCRPCDQEGHVDVTGVFQNCALCPERELLGVTRCVLKCPSDKPMRDAYNACKGCDEPNFNQSGNAQDCKKCPNRVLVAHNCILACGQGIYKDKPVMDNNANCHACDEKGNFRMAENTKDQCAMCPDRELVGDMCAKKCPSETPMPGINGTCYACDEQKPVTVSGGKGACDMCPNRIFGGIWNGYCYLPCGQGIYKDKPLANFVGICFSCDEKNAVDVLNVTKNCDVCENRELNGQYCRLKTECPSDKPLKAIDGTCYACGEEKPVQTAKEVCDTVCPNRYYENQWCSLPCGDGIYADKPLRGSNGVCYSCQEPQNIYVAQVSANCRVCENREVIDNYCKLKKESSL